jgi:hypothetical protein
VFVGGVGAGSGGRGGSTAPTAALAALASAPADEYLSEGFFAKPRAITSSNAREMPRRMMLGRGGGVNMCALISWRKSPSVSKGALPVRHSYSRHVNE